MLLFWLLTLQIMSGITYVISI